MELLGALKDHTGRVDRKFGWAGMFVSCSARSLPCMAGSSDSSLIAMKSNFNKPISGTIDLQRCHCFHGGNRSLFTGM